MISIRFELAGSVWRSDLIRFNRIDMHIDLDTLLKHLIRAAKLNDAHLTSP